MLTLVVCVPGTSSWRRSAKL